VNIKEGKKDVLLPQAVGLLTSIAALSDDKDYLANGFFSDMKSVLRRKGKKLKDIINEKRKKHTSFEDTGIIDLSGDDVEILP